MKTLALVLLAAAGIGGAAVTRVSWRPAEAIRQSSGEALTVTPTDGDRLARIREAGLSGDPNQIPALLDVLANPKHGYDRYTAIHALAQLHAADAVPALDDLISREGPGNLRNYARVARARILAESRAARISDSAQKAEATAREFLDQLGVDIQHLNGALPERVLAARRSHWTIAVELYALRELADMVYRSRDAGLRDRLQKLGVAFEADEPSATKWRLALLTRDQRIAALVEELSHAKMMGPGGEYEKAQLLIDEGTTATSAVVAKLAQMDADRAHYPSIAYSGLLAVFRGSGEKDLEPLVARYLNGSDRDIAHDAFLAYPYVSRGLKMQYRAGY